MESELLKSVRRGAIGVLTGLVLMTAVAAAAPVHATVSVATNASLGPILVDASGMTLYHDSTACTGSCVKQWPPLLIATGTKATAGSGVKAALLGTVKASGGKLQVTYDGLTLSLYAGDTKAGEANGQGVAGVWHAIAPSGRIIAKTVSSGKTGSTGSSSSVVTPTSSSGVSSSGGSASSVALTEGSPTSDVPGVGCAPGTGIPQGPGAGDSDEDNGDDGPGVPTSDDGDGCL